MILLYEFKKLLKLNKFDLLEENVQNLRNKIVNNYLKNIIIHLAKIRYTTSVIHDFRHWVSEINSCVFEIHEIISKRNKHSKKIKLKTVLNDVGLLKESYYNNINNELRTYTLTEQIDYDFLFGKLEDIVEIIFKYRYNSDTNRLKQEIKNILEELRDANSITKTQRKVSRYLSGFNV